MFVKLKDRTKLHFSCLKGFVFMSMADLFNTVGEPHYNQSDDNSEIEWTFEDEEGRPVCLYDWHGSSGSGKFHIGAHSYEVAANFKLWLESQLSERSLLNYGG